LPGKQLYIPSREEIQDFCDAIAKINPHCSFNLHILLPPSYCKMYCCHFIFDKTDLQKRIINDKIFIHYLEQDENIDPVIHQCRHWSWNNVFQCIENR